MYLKKKSLKKKEKNLGVNIRPVVDINIMFYVQIGYISVYTNEQGKMNKTCNDKGICYLTFPDFLCGWLFFTIIGQTFEWYRRKWSFLELGRLSGLRHDYRCWPRSWHSRFQFRGVRERWVNILLNFNSSSFDIIGGGQIMAPIALVSPSFYGHFTATNYHARDLVIVNSFRLMLRF